MTDSKYLYLIVLLIIGIVVEGCISTQDLQESIGNTVSYHENEEMPIIPTFELEVNDADNNTRKIIYSILNNTEDQDAVGYISSINIVSKMDDILCDYNSTGCTIGSFANGKLLEAKIYVLNPYSYKGLCNTFEHTLYHEIGHVVYFYKFGNNDNYKEDILYIESLELYAEKYADRYYNIQKEGCGEEFVRQLKQRLDEKEKLYQFSINVLSKWDKYGDSGIPRDMYDEYLYDRNLYQDAKKEYNDVVEEYKYYMKKVQE